MNLVKVLGTAYGVPAFDRPFRHTVLPLQFRRAILPSRLPSLADVTLGLFRFSSATLTASAYCSEIRSFRVFVQTFGSFKFTVGRRAQSLDGVLVQTLGPLQFRASVLGPFVQGFRSFQSGSYLEVRHTLEFLQFVRVIGFEEIVAKIFREFARFIGLRRAGVASLSILQHSCVSFVIESGSIVSLLVSIFLRTTALRSLSGTFSSD